MKINIFIVLLIGLLISCGKNRKEIYLICENADGIEAEKTKLRISGFEIGQVNKISLLKNGEILITAELQPEIELPKNSNFKIVSAGLLGSKNIEIIRGSEKSFIKYGDTIRTSLLEKTTDSIFSKAVNFIESFSNKKQNDSILFELKRLNKKLDKLNKQMN